MSRQATLKSSTIFPLYIPVALAFIFSAMPIVSYLIAWFGSFFIFYWTWFSPSVYYKNDVPVKFQLMRPIFLLQLIFAGFMCCTSIFYFLDHLGYRYFTEQNNILFHENELTGYIAQCQRLNLLAHAAVVTGIIWATQRKTATRVYQVIATTDFLIGFSIGIYAVGLLTQQINGFLQVALILNTVAAGGGALLFTKGIAVKNTRYLAVGSAIFITNFLNATLSGFKEPVIVNVIILFCLLYPYYKKTILLLSVPAIYVLLFILPTYTSVVRKSWSGETTAQEARTEALDLILDEDSEDERDETTWGFLTNRLSEINMFTQFVAYVPSQHDYYGWEIFNQSIEVLVPRIFWPNKPSAEALSMERVYDAGVASRLSNVSAKTRPIVDAYLGWGIVGVFLFMLAYGYIAQWLLHKCEQLYGGYELGCIVMFNSLFQTMWRGNNFEFMFSNIFYGALLMYVIFTIMKSMRIIQPQFSKLSDLPHRPNPFVKPRTVQSDFK